MCAIMKIIAHLLYKGLLYRDKITVKLMTSFHKYTLWTSLFR